MRKLFFICLLLPLLSSRTHLASEVVSYTAKEKIIAIERQQLSSTLRSSLSHQQQQITIEAARNEFIAANVELMQYWLGTAWSFHGTSQIPQSDSIACGYFVTTILDDVGLKIQRAKLAQQTSENIIKSLIDEKNIKRYSNKSLNSFVNSVDHWGAGLYIVGLDFHVGFIWHDGKDIHFIHSTFVSPSGVIHESALSSPVLNASKYRVLGKISEDDKLIKKWL